MLHIEMKEHDDDIHTKVSKSLSISPAPSPHH